MELYQLRTFVVVAEEGHLSRAAERLFVSQPAVSAHVKALEEELGVQLFTRTSRGMDLTPQGRELKIRAERALAAANDVVYAAKALKDELAGALRVGLNTDSRFLRISALVSALAGSHPLLSLALEDSMTGKVISDVCRGSLDGGFIFTRSWEELEAELGPGVLDGMHLCPFRVQVAAPAAWAGRIEGAGLAELAALPWIWTPEYCPFHHMLHDLFTRQKLTPAKVIEANGEHLLRALVAEGRGLTLLRDDEIARGLEAGELVVWPGRDFGLGAYYISLRSREADPHLRALRAAVRQAWGMDPEAQAPSPTEQLEEAGQ
jgi:DNA-binding transcriptional LysR family regulator